jgi:hypothetical protein
MGDLTATIPWPFFAYRKDWSRVGVATLQKIGQDWEKRLEKGLAKDWMFFLASFWLVHPGVDHR